MESALVSMVSLALIIIASVTTMMNSFSAVNSIMDSWNSIESAADDKRRTDIAVIPPENYESSVLEVYVNNQGYVKLGSFDEWDFIVQLQNGEVYYIDFTDNISPEENQWTVEGIYISDNLTVSEVFDSDILNPGESAKLIVNLNPDIEDGTYGLLTVSTNNGVTAQCHVHNP